MLMCIVTLQERYGTCYFSKSIWPLSPLAECLLCDMIVFITYFGVIVLYLIIYLFFSLLFKKFVFFCVCKSDYTPKLCDL